MGVIGGAGVFIHIFVLCSTDISFEINSNSKEIRRAEHEYMNKHPPTSPPISVLVTSMLTPSPKMIIILKEISFNCGNAAINAPWVPIDKILTSLTIIGLQLNILQGRNKTAPSVFPQSVCYKGSKI